MLDDLAVRFISQSEETFQAIMYGFIALGAIVAALVTRSKAELTRAPFFAYAALVGFLMVTVNIIWLSPDAAITGGYLWLFVAASIAATFLGGFFLCRLAMERSRDAFGYSGGAILAFIPLLNLWLMLKPSQKNVSANRVPTIPLVSGGLGVLTGFVLIAATMGVVFYIEAQTRITEQQRQAQTTADADVVEFITRSVRANGLAMTLERMAAESQTPFRIDNVTTLARIETDGKQLQRTYLVDTDGMSLSEEVRSGIRSNVCAQAVFAPILEAGGAIKESYVQRDGRAIGSVTVTREECGY
jgi:hypothetical protein